MNACFPELVSHRFVGIPKFSPQSRVSQQSARRGYRADCTARALRSYKQHVVLMLVCLNATKAF